MFYYDRSQFKLIAPNFRLVLARRAEPPLWRFVDGATTVELPPADLGEYIIERCVQHLDAIGVGGPIPVLEALVRHNSHVQLFAAQAMVFMRTPTTLTPTSPT